MGGVNGAFMLCYNMNVVAQSCITDSKRKSPVEKLKHGAPNRAVADLCSS